MNPISLARLLNQQVKNRISSTQEQGNSKYDGCMSTWLASKKLSSKHFLITMLNSFF